MEPSRRASGGSRQRSSSTASTASAASTVSSITEEDYDLIASAAVPDGFRPSGGVPSNPTARRPVPLPSGPLLPPPQAVNPSFSKWNHRPSSVAKPPRPHDSLTIRADGSNAANSTQSGGNGVPPLPVEAPYRGPSNPVHPYGMYPQRTLSNATDRSARASRSSYTGPRGPSHPYTLYTQGTAGNTVEANQQIPLGFNGMSAPYERQIGPDGEEVGDLLGPLGHTEELPPYSRYPEVAFTTKPQNGTAAATPATTAGAATAAPTHTAQEGERSSEPVATVAAVPEAETAMADSEAQENPFASAEDALVPAVSRHSMRSLASYRDNPSEESYSEKDTNIQTKWQRRARKKLWGVLPYWSICLVLVGLILGAVLGAVIGTVLLKGSSTTDSATQAPDLDQAPDPTAIDIQQLPNVPATLLPLPVGPFALPQLDGGRARRFCVNDTSQLPAWSCNMPFRFYSMNIIADFHQSSTERYNLTLTPINHTQSQLLWGTQPPFIKDPITMKLVSDTMDKENRGPAWWTTVLYDKTVIVQENDLSPLDKRSWFPGSTTAAIAGNIEKTKYMKQTYQAVPGDALWQCTWPQTLLEILIYPGQNVSTTTSASASPSPRPTSADLGDFDLDAPFEPLAPYPRLVRMLERRTANCGPATCTKYSLPGGSHTPLVELDPDGNPVEITISENMNVAHRYHNPPRPYSGSGESEYKDRDADESGIFARDALEFTPCGCLWSQ